MSHYDQHVFILKLNALVFAFCFHFNFVYYIMTYMIMSVPVYCECIRWSITMCMCYYMFGCICCFVFSLIFYLKKC